MAISNTAESSHVCVVGAGPAGVILSLLLARKKIPVTLLESQADFNRDFRGDTLHASSLEILEQIGYADNILKISSAKLDKLQLDSSSGPVTVANFSYLETKYPFVALIPQERFLGFLTEEAKKLPDFQLIMNAKVNDLIRKDNKYCGVIYKHGEKTSALEACLVIGADGRGSTVRQKADLKLGKTSPPMDVIWFKLPRDKKTAKGNAAGIRFGAGTMLVMIDRGDEWQLGYVILKGSYKKLREKGMALFREELCTLAHELKSSFAMLEDWSQCAILSVVTGRVKKWHEPGLLLIGDAAHVMSPVGGVGINYAIQDAVATANILSEPLKKGKVTEQQISSVQQRRENSVRLIQLVQSLIQKRIIAAAINSDVPFQPPLPLRLLSKSIHFQKKMAYLLAYGLRHENLENA